MNAALMPLLLIGVFYFLIWRPQQKQMEDARKFRDSLAVGDKIVTSGGMYGKITEVASDHVVVEVAPRVNVRIARTQVVERQKDAPTAAAPAEEAKDK
jgi:preprotein translocase subunit YajC